jgi:tetratricopeptide (TPR) repeat protein
MEVQDEVTGRIASALGTELIEVESRRSLRERPANPDALDLTMRGWSALHHLPSSEVLTEAKSRFEKALALDAHAVDALIGLGYCLLRRAQSGFDQRRNEDVATAAELVQRALALDPQRARAHWLRGMVLRNQGKLEQAVAAFEEAIALDRNFAPAYGSLGDVVGILDRPEDTIHFNEQAIRLSPRDPQLANWLFDVAQAHLMLEHYKEALTWALRAHTANPNFPWAALCLAVAYAFTGETEAAQATLNEFHRIKPEIKSYTDLRAAVPLFDLPQARRLATRLAHGMQLLGMAGLMHQVGFSIRYLHIRSMQSESASDCVYGLPFACLVLVVFGMT